ncbi:MAG TPA: acyl-CoA dehydrogenase family protein [Verrucomicrobiae bacterium]|nr:acyl-CoA dehydrogenase family protein [Verrucomicrobiae bacterium]
MSVTKAHRQIVAVPEPNLTPEEMIERAIALQPRLRAEQEETERRGVHSEAIHREFQKAGFYRCLQPRLFGGYEFDLKTYYRIGIEISRGCPSTGWCLIVGAGHALMLGSYFGEEAQADGFGPAGDFSAPSVAAPHGTATPTEDGWLVKGKWAYASGAPYATHFMPSVLIQTSPSAPLTAGIALIPRSQWKMLDDWGAILGMRGSGSNSIVVEGARVPKSHVIQIDMLNTDLSSGTPGLHLHGNPMYCGRCLSFFHAELVAVMVGLGYAAIDEYEHIIRTKNTLYPPMKLRYLHHDYQRYLGLALGMMNAAKRLVLDAGDVYMEYCHRGCSGGPAFMMEEDVELFASLEHGGRLAWDAIEMLFRTSSSSGAKDGERMQRYYRDASIYRGHLSAQYDMHAARLGLIHLGMDHGVSTVDRGAPPQTS